MSAVEWPIVAVPGRGAAYKTEPQQPAAAQIRAVPNERPKADDDWWRAVMQDGLELVPSDAPTAAPEGITERYPVLDWADLWASARAEPEWLCEPLLEAGRVVALYSPAKTGKSLLALEIAAALAAGQPVLGNPARPPVRVLYVDLENSRDDIRERLEHLGYGPRDLGELRYLSFPSLPALDSPSGGADLLALAQHHAARLVVLDTVSRVIDGDEDTSTTFRALYRHAVMPLKAAGTAVLRLDHSGKDVSRGQRGSSSKNDDVDAVWLLTRRTDGKLDLRRTHSRTNHGAEYLEIVRRLEPLRHDVPTFGQPSEADEVARRLDDLGVPRDAGRPAARKALNASGYKVNNPVLERAVRQRKTAAQLPGAVGDGQGSDEDDTTAPGAAPDMIASRSNDCPGQSGGSQGSAPTGSCPDLPPRPSHQGTGRAVGGPTSTTYDPAAQQPPSVLRPCTRCGGECVRYGPGASALCPACPGPRGGVMRATSGAPPTVCAARGDLA